MDGLALAGTHERRRARRLVARKQAGDDDIVDIPTFAAGVAVGAKAEAELRQTVHPIEGHRAGGPVEGTRIDRRVLGKRTRLAGGADRVRVAFVGHDLPPRRSVDGHLHDPAVVGPAGPVAARFGIHPVPEGELCQATDGNLGGHEHPVGQARVVTRTRAAELPARGTSGGVVAGTAHVPLVVVAAALHVVGPVALAGLDVVGEDDRQVAHHVLMLEGDLEPVGRDHEAQGHLMSGRAIGGHGKAERAAGVVALAAGRNLAQRRLGGIELHVGIIGYQRDDRVGGRFGNRVVAQREHQFAGLARIGLLIHVATAQGQIQQREVDARGLHQIDVLRNILGHQAGDLRVRRPETRTIDLGAEAVDLRLRRLLTVGPVGRRTRAAVADRLSRLADRVAR